MKRILTVLSAISLTLMLMVCAGCSNEPQPIVGTWEGDGVIFLKTYDVIIEANADGTIKMNTDQVTHSTSSVGINFEGTWKRIKASDVPGGKITDSGDGNSAVYEIDFKGTTYYAFVSDKSDGEGKTLAMTAITSDGEADLTKPIVTAYPETEKELLNATELEAQISEQPVRVIETEYKVYDENYKNLYPDFLMATVLNESGSTIKSLKIGFVAWDANGLPVTITPKGQSKDYYFVETTNDNANIVNGATWNEAGVALSGNVTSNISQFKAIVTSYTDYDGNTWTNPLLDNWQEVFEDKPLS